MVSKFLRSIASVKFLFCLFTCLLLYLVFTAILRWNKTSTKLVSDLRVTVLGTNPYGEPDKPDSTLEVSETDWVVEQSQ